VVLTRFNNRRVGFVLPRIYLLVNAFLNIEFQLEQFHLKKWRQMSTGFEFNVVFSGLLIIVERKIIPRLIQRGIMKFLKYRHETFRVPRKSRDVYQETLAVHIHSMSKGTTTAGNCDQI